MELECKYMNINSSFAESGYDVPVFGIGSSCFTTIHVTAMVCLLLSLIVAASTVIILFKSSEQSFMKWHRHKRFLIYRCTCDIIYSFVHSLDHGQILIAQDHVRPKGLCTIYGMIIVSICLSEASLSLVSALNAYLAIYFRREMRYGQRDWKLLTGIFLVPLTAVIGLYFFDVFGPSGFFCVFDSVKGVVANAIISTGALSTMLVALIIFYTITWRKIYVEDRILRQTTDIKNIKSATISSSKAMCLFVAVYIIQWTSASIYGAWQLVAEVPFGLFLSVVVLTNLGGVLSGFIYISNMARRNKISIVKEEHRNTTKQTIDDQNNKTSSMIENLKPKSMVES